MSMTIHLLIGAGPLAALMAADRGAEGGALEALAFGADPSGGSYDRGVDQPRIDQPKKVANREDSAAASRVSHSQITNDDQPAAASASVTALSRARLRAILAVQ